MAMWEWFWNEWQNAYKNLIFTKLYLCRLKGKHFVPFFSHFWHSQFCFRNTLAIFFAIQTKESGDEKERHEWSEYKQKIHLSCFIHSPVCTQRKIPKWKTQAYTIPYFLVLNSNLKINDINQLSTITIAAITDVCTAMAKSTLS